MIQTSSFPAAVFCGLVDLAAERTGGRALAASDDFFAAKENLLRGGRGVFEEGRYTERGKWMDGWESRRRRTPGCDWCVVALGIPGIVEGVDVDTCHFLGNHPFYAALDGCELLSDDAACVPAAPWRELVPRSPLRPGSQNLMIAAERRRVTHLRLRIYPDGGVARLRAYGRPAPDWRRLAAAGDLDLAALAHGGAVVAASDMFFGVADNLLLPGPSRDMGDGWETRRRRGPGHDWVIVRLARRGRIRRVEIDTSHFKGNFPERASLDGCRDPAAAVDQLTWPEAEWVELLAPSRLEADRVHRFESEIVDQGPWEYVRLNVYPDGGVARLRLYGAAEEPGDAP